MIAEVNADVVDMIKFEKSIERNFDKFELKDCIKVYENYKSF